MKRALDRELTLDEGQAVSSSVWTWVALFLFLEEVEQAISKSLGDLVFYFQENIGLRLRDLAPILNFSTPLAPGKELGLSAPVMACGRSLEFDRIGR